MVSEKQKYCLFTCFACVHACGVVVYASASLSVRLYTCDEVCIIGPFPVRRCMHVYDDLCVHM